VGATFKRKLADRIVRTDDNWRESTKTLGSLTKAGPHLFANETEREWLYFRKQYGWADLLADVLLSTLADTIFAPNVPGSYRDKEQFLRLVQQIKVRVATLLRTRV